MGVDRGIFVRTRVVWPRASFSHPMQSDGEDGVVLRCQNPDCFLIQLNATLAVVCVRLKQCLSGPAYSELSKSTSPRSPVACKVLLGPYDMASLRYRACELCVSAPPPAPVVGPTSVPEPRPPAQGPERSGRFKLYKRPRPPDSSPAVVH